MNRGTLHNLLLAVVTVALAASARTTFGAGACVRVSTLSPFTPSCSIQPDQATCEATPNARYFGDGTTCADVPDVYFYPGGGQINISGATLFVDFFKLPAATNDWINADGDSIPCSGDPLEKFSDLNCDTFFDGVDQLAPPFSCGSPWNGFWIVQDRSVGSGNGLAEFVDFQLLGKIPSSVCTEGGLLNTISFNGNGTKIGLSVCEANCFPPLNWADMNCDGSINGADVEGWVDEFLGAIGCDAPNLRGDMNEDAITDLLDLDQFVGCVLDGGVNCGRPLNTEATPVTNDSGTPVCPVSVDMAVMDVPTKWFVIAPGGAASWNRKPTVAGYGDAGVKSWDTNKSNKLKTLNRVDTMGNPITLNVDTANPDQNTVFDYPLAYVAVGMIANRGTGLENVTFTDLHYGFVTGRFPNGENYQMCTRDAGSGTRNAGMNSLGIDPSWAVGDNLGNQSQTDDQSNVRRDGQGTNCGGSGIMERAVKVRRLAVGYTGLLGGSRIQGDLPNGDYEMLNVKKDIAGGVQYVRPSVDSVLDNSDVNTGWQIGGSETFATRGDPFSGLDGNTNPPMNRMPPRDYLRNIALSIASYVNSGAAPEFLSPAELLVNKFMLNVSVDAEPQPTDPADYQLTNGFVQAIQDDVRALNPATFPAYGSVNPGTGGRVPTRQIDATLYSDGSTSLYLDEFGVPTFGSSSLLFPRMTIQGDFDANGVRDVNDIAPLMAAIQNPRTFEANDAAANPGNYLIPEIIGDFNSDGDFDHVDIRYFADGLAMVAGQLDRKQGFIDVDSNWAALTAPGNFYFTDATQVPTVTTLICGAYDAGDARGDVAGNTPWRGAQPNGQDGVINHADINYVRANAFSGAWGTNLDNHFDKDLSCDMNGDLVVDNNDVVEIVVNILDTQMGDVDLNGVLDCNDLATINGNVGVINSGATYAQGDLDGDGDVDAADAAMACGNCVSCSGICCP